MTTVSANYWKGVIETIDLISGLSAKYYQGLIQGKELPELLEEIEAKASLKLTSGMHTLASELGLESMVESKETQKFDQDYWRAVKDTTAYARNWILRNEPNESIFARFLYQIRKKATQKLGEEVNPLERELGEITVAAQEKATTATSPLTTTPHQPTTSLDRQPTAQPLQVDLPSTTARRPTDELIASTPELETSPGSEVTPPKMTESSRVISPTPPSSPAASESVVPALDELEQMDFPTTTPPPMRPKTTRPSVPATTSRSATTSLPPRPLPPSPLASPQPSPQAATPSPSQEPSVSSSTSTAPGIPDLSMLMSEDFGDLARVSENERVPESIKELQRFEMEEKPISPNEPTLKDALLGSADKSHNVGSPSSDEDEDELSASLKSALRMLRDEED